jgi:alpha-beta hydrolase superfamily lysophospholipase
VHRDYLRFLPADLRTVAAGIDPEPTWWRWRDAELHVARCRPPGATVRVLVVHGAGGWSGALWPVAALIAAAGIEVAAPDLPGYGRSRVPDPAGVRYPHWVDCVADLVRHERATDDRPLILLGASLGGLLCYDVAGRLPDQVAGLLVTCLLDPRDPAALARIGRNRWSGPLGARLLPPLAAAVPAVDRLRVPIRWLANLAAISNDPGLAALCARDPAGGGGRVPLGFLRTWLASVPAVEPAGYAGPPPVLAHPADDRWTPEELSRRFLDRVAGPTRLVPLAGAGHYPIETPGLRRLIAEVTRLAGAAT